jgi:two-component system, NarL family, sensor histidine kinase DesK
MDRGLDPALSEPGHYRGMSAFTGLRRSVTRVTGPVRAAITLPADSAVPTSQPISYPPGQVRPLRVADQLSRQNDVENYISRRARFLRTAVVVAFLLIFLVKPLAAAAWRHGTPSSAFLLFGTLAFTALALPMFNLSAAARRATLPQAWAGVTVALAIALFVVGSLPHLGGQNSGGWISVLAVAAALCGQVTLTIWPAVIGAASCVVAGMAVGLSQHYADGLLAAVLILPPMAAYLAYSGGKRAEISASLRQTRAELARMAAAEERLRIARDLHDLLGHSLSLITLKAELSRRMMSADAERAAQELAELESVARQSLSDVREAVAGYRQPDLAAELGAARQLLSAAGIGCRVIAPEELELPAEVDAALAWTVREGTTNVVRHAAAGTVTIAICAAKGQATAEIIDDGRAGEPAACPQTQLQRGGSGLAGLSERVRQLGGDLAAGPVSPAGFRLRVTIPVGSDSAR